VADSRLRDIGTIVPGARLEPNPPAVQSPPIASHSSSASEAVPASAPIFATDLPGGADALGLAPPLALLAELAAHKRTETPLTIGLFGPSGSGKSFALTKLIEAIAHLSRAAGTQASPYTSEIVTLRVEATDLAGNPATALAGALHSGLARTYPAFAAEAAHAARDPRAAVTEALETLDVTRRKLDAEKRDLDETNVRRARLAEAILYETSGSQVDAYAAANRTLIKSLFGRLGVTGDPLLAFKDMAGTAASTNGVARRAGFAPRAFFGFKGQTKLIATAILLVLAGAGLRIAVDQQAVWLAWLRATDSSVPIANWLEPHMDLLLRLLEVLFVGAALAIGINVWRGWRLLRLVSRGADLLQADLTIRRRELHDLFAFQARRVEALAADVNILSRRAAEVERRAADVQAGHLTVAEPAPFAIDAATQQARAFAAAVGAMLARPVQTSPNKSGGAPRRIVFAIDHLDAVAASRSCEILAHARSLFSQGFVLLIAADLARLAAGGAAPEPDKWIDVPFQLGQLASRANYAALVDQIPVERPVHDASTSVLDEAMSADEKRLLTNLAPLAGGSPRALKRFINLYRIVRAQNQLHKGALAFMLALDAGGTLSEIATVYDTLSQTSPDATFDLHQGGAGLLEALAAAQSPQGKINLRDARQAAAAAGLFSFRDRGSRR
jgi:KAP family P-loop domain